MAKESMIQREKKRDRLINKYREKRAALKHELKIAATYPAKVSLLKKIEKFNQLYSLSLVIRFF